MRVGVYVGNVPANLGGAFTFQQEIIAALAERASRSNHEFVVFGNFTEQHRASLASPKLEICNVKSARASSVVGNLAEIVFEKPLLLLRALGLRSRFDRLLRKRRIDLVWFVGPLHEATDSPFIFTVWDLQHRLQPWFPEVSSSGRWFFREHNYGRVLPRAFRIIVANRAGAAELERFYRIPPERILQLPHPTPAFALYPPPSLPDVRAKFALTRGFLLYPAQFWAHKNHVGLFRAVQALSRRFGVELDVALVGSEKGNLQHVKNEAARLGLREKVRFLGFVTREELIALYREATALVYLSFFGPENLPPLEAFALGCPVVAARVSGAEDQFGDAALLVDPIDPEAVADAIRSVAADKTLRATLVERGLRRARASTSEQYVERVLAEMDRFAPVRACWAEGDMPIA